MCSDTLSPTQNAVVQFNQVDFSRGSRKIFDRVDLAIPKGKVTAILGPSGVGKTTLLKLMGGLLDVDHGVVSAFDQDIAQLSRRDLYRLRCRMGVLFQSGALFTDLSVFENVAFPLRQHTDLPENILRNVVLMKLEAVGLRGAANLMPAELSGGMNRRVALARAIALDPEVMLYDEPFTGQDPISMGVLMKLIRALNDALQLTSVVVSHDVEEVLSIADYVYILAGAEVVCHGTPDDIRKNKTDQVKQFINGLPDGPVPFNYPAKSLAQAFGLEHVS